MSTIYGNAFDNDINGTDANDYIDAGAGRDTVRAKAGDDTVYAGDGDDWIDGGGGNDQLWGDAGNDMLIGGAGDDYMVGGGGNDTYYIDSAGDLTVEGGDDGIDLVRVSVDFYALGYNIENGSVWGSVGLHLTGNKLDNVLVGGSGGDTLSGVNGTDILRGAAGNDTLLGGGDDDVLKGGVGNDWVEGGAGQDLLTGGSGADLFVFRDGDLGSTRATADRIHDFNHAEGDQIRLDFIDANCANGSGTNEQFSFIGSSAFHHIPGELRYEQIVDNTYVYGDTNGDGIADFAIRVDGSQTVVAGDLIL